MGWTDVFSLCCWRLHEDGKEDNITDACTEFINSMHKLYPRENNIQAGISEHEEASV